MLGLDPRGSTAHAAKSLQLIQTLHRLVNGHNEMARDMAVAATAPSRDSFL
jgi:hypothetical protein